MNKTVKLILSIYKLKKIKPSYINWKTFNAKQTNIHVPKVVNILKKINNAILVSIKKQIKIQENLLMYTSYKNDKQLTNINIIQNKINSKHITYTSIFKTKKAKDSINKDNIYINVQNSNKISIQYIIYILLTNMYINIKNTTVTTVALPRKRTAYTVLKSPHADKKAREQYMKELFNVRISLQNYVATMQYINSIVLSYTKAFIHSYKYDAFYENKI